MSFNEYIPNGYSSWMEYNRHNDSRKETIQNVKHIVDVLLMAMVIIGSIIGKAYVETML